MDVSEAIKTSEAVREALTKDGWALTATWVSVEFPPHGVNILVLKTVPLQDDKMEAVSKRVRELSNGKMMAVLDFNGGLKNAFSPDLTPKIVEFLRKNAPTLVWEKSASRKERQRLKSTGSCRPSGT